MDAGSGEPFDFDCALPQVVCCGARRRLRVVDRLGLRVANRLGQQIWKSSALLFVHRSPRVRGSSAPHEETR
jgi:hypothetical protein